MVQDDSGLGLPAAAPVIHRQCALQAPDQIVSASGRTQDADRPLVGPYPTLFAKSMLRP